MSEAVDLSGACALDAADPLRAHRARFVLPPGVVYLDGNSLGALPAAAPSRVAEVVADEWGKELVGGWNARDWIGAPARVGARIAKLVGAQPDEVIVADSTSINLFKLIAAAMTAASGRSVILGEAGDFPTDVYVARGAARLRSDWTLDLRPTAEIASALDKQVALLVLSHVHYRSAARHDLEEMTRRAHRAGALVLWDLSHSAGALAIDLDAAGVDLAVGCGYKYLNGGPGAPAFLFVAKRWQSALASPLQGWMGHAEPFAFAEAYAPAPGVERFLCGTPPIVSMAALEAGVDAFEGVDMILAERKSQRLAQLFIDEVERRCPTEGLRLLTPRDPLGRGCHVSFAHPHAWPVMQALIHHGVVGDVRAPDIVRFGFPALYLSFEDVWRAAEILERVLTTGVWKEPRFAERKKVT